ncbi:MAG TPA: NfeD family protein [Gammaproteobacteria bacterium]|jgi:membrane protein implicated in regulation of membrane protease activity
MAGSDLFLIWFIGGVVLMVLEFVLPGGIVFFLGLGATLVALLLHLGLIDGWVQAFTTWFIGSLALLFGLRGVVQKIIPAQVERGGTDEDLDAYNKVATVAERIPADGVGRISFRGSTWAARNYHGDRDLEPGTDVRIIFRDNLEWMVEAVEGRNNEENQT